MLMGRKHEQRRRGARVRRQSSRAHDAGGVVTALVRRRGNVRVERAMLWRIFDVRIRRAFGARTPQLFVAGKVRVTCVEHSKSARERIGRHSLCEEKKCVGLTIFFLLRSTRFFSRHADFFFRRVFYFYFYFFF